MEYAQEIAARINESTVALLVPGHYGKPIRFWIGQAQEAMSEAEQTLSAWEMDRVRYAFDAFKTQYMGL